MEAHLTNPIDLAQVKLAFAAWRKQRQGRERIPQYLWDAAIALLNHHPISTVQKQLSLNLKQLKQRCAAQGHPYQSSLAGPQFLEIKPALFAAQTNQPQLSNNSRQIAAPIAPLSAVCLIAFERNDGSRLTVSLPADSPIIPAICANLLRA